MLTSASLEAVSLGAVLPFLSVLAIPEQVLSYPMVGQIAQSLGTASPDELVLPLTIAFCVAAIAAGSSRLLLLWANARLSHAIGHDVTVEIYRRTLFQPYRVHALRNSSEIISVVAKTKAAIATLNAILNMASFGLIGLFVMTALFLIDPGLILVCLLGLGSIYLIASAIVRNRLRRYGGQEAVQQTVRMKALQEGLGGIRDVLLDGSQAVFTAVFRRANLTLNRAQSRILFLSQSPLYIVETIGMVLIAGLAYVLSEQTTGFVGSIPMLGALAMAAQRLLPALQQIYRGWATVRSRHASLVDVILHLEQPIGEEHAVAKPQGLNFEESIEFRKVAFSYHHDGPMILRDVDFRIPKGASVGIVGVTGSGKSTVLDLMMGLLEPSEGDILIDDQRLVAGNRRAWQNLIGHVPQSVYLADATLAENIAFGVPPGAIDIERVREAALLAQIAELADSSPDGYQLIIGERGTRLSGGQRQRIGIARALYKQSKVLIFDEATSALDTVTEQMVMDSVRSLDRTKTSILITHRLGTVRNCDPIFLLEGGRIAASGSYDELLKTSPRFRLMAMESVGSRDPSRVADGGQS